MFDLSNHPLALMVRTLSLWGPLSDWDRKLLLNLPYERRRLNAHQYLVWEGDTPQYTCVILSGFAIRHKIAGDGGRQILSIHMKGDIVDLQNSLLGVADHNIQMLGSGEAAVIPVAAIRALAARHPSIGMAMWYATLVTDSIVREWTLNIGRRDAVTRIAHLLCELALRLEVADLGGQGGYELPISQEQLADAVGLTPVHVNRSLMKLEADGLIARTKRDIMISDWERLAKFADFDSAYLHLDRRMSPELSVPRLAATG